jgi:hypothetical protein
MDLQVDLSALPHGTASLIGEVTTLRPTYITAVQDAGKTIRLPKLKIIARIKDTYSQHTRANSFRTFAVPMAFPSNICSLLAMFRLGKIEIEIEIASKTELRKYVYLFSTASRSHCIACCLPSAKVHALHI